MNRTLLPLVLVLAACSSNPEPAPAPVPVPTQTVTPTPTPPAASGAFDPVGSYDFTVEFQGQTQSGVITITKQDGKIAGTLSGPGGEAISLSNVTVEGRKINAVGTIPNGPELNMTMNFETNDKFAGTVAVQGMSLPLAGSRKKSS